MSESSLTSEAPLGGPATPPWSFSALFFLLSISLLFSALLRCSFGSRSFGGSLPRWGERIRRGFIITRVESFLLRGREREGGKEDALGYLEV